jgi:hypothetical protein
MPNPGGRLYSDHGQAEKPVDQATCPHRVAGEVPRERPSESRRSAQRPRAQRPTGRRGGRTGRGDPPSLRSDQPGNPCNEEDQENARGERRRDLRGRDALI